MNFFKTVKEKIFGCTEELQPPQRYQPPEEQDVEDYQRFNDQNRDDFGFRVFSNPLEMHRYFERQMNEVFKNFGMTGRDEGFFGRSDPFFEPQVPGIDEAPHGGTLRDHYLKPGCENHSNDDSYRRGDRVIDGHVDIGELDQVIKPERGNQERKLKSQFFGHSISSKTVVAADGSTEMHRTMRDSQGNEETTVTKKFGDKEYTVTTKIDSSGKKEINENILNMDEKELEFFKNRLPDNEKMPPIMDNSDSDRNIFDKLFGSKM